LIGNNQSDNLHNSEINKIFMLKKLVSSAFTRIVILFSIAGMLSSCKHEPNNLANLPIVCFDTQVQPIFSGSCAMAGCHSGGGRERGGFDPSSYSSLMNSVKAGDPWGSTAYTIVSSPNNPNMMPPQGHKPLTLEQRTLIEVWILQGAKDTRCDTAATGGTQGLSKIINKN
jgi:hypothetical protein